MFEGLENTSSNGGEYESKEERKRRDDVKRSTDHQPDSFHRQHKQPVQRTISNSRASPSARAMRNQTLPDKKQPGFKHQGGSQSSLSSAFSLPVAANVTSISAGAQVYKVSKNKTTAPGEYDSIQAAIDDAQPYSLIRISPGIYLEPITITKPLKLIAEAKF